MTGAEAMVKCLEHEGARVIFGYPGAAICPFYDALLPSPIHHVLVRSEQNAAHSASGYARMTGTVGVCIATSGPGATNLLTGIATAYMDSIPMVAITGQVRSDLLGSDVFQEADTTGAAEPFTKHTYLVKNAKDLARVLREAFHIASTGRPGPVLVDVPVDVQLAQAGEPDFDAPINIIGYKPSVQGHALQIKKAVDAIEAAARPVICAGGGVLGAEACGELRELAERRGIPVVHTMMGIGTLPTAHPLALGMIGSHGVVAANKAIRDADLIILAGARVGDRSVAAPDQVAKRAKIIHIDIDPAEIGKNMAVNVPIVGHLRGVLAALGESVGRRAPEEWVRQVTDRRERYATAEHGDKPSGFVNPMLFMRSLSRLMKDDAVLCADVGQNQIWSANHFEIRSSRFLTTGGMGTMGYSIPCAAGAALADGRRQVCAVCGDGSFQMEMAELATICQERLPVKIVVMRNTRLGMVREIQDNLYKGQHSAVYLDGSPDITKIALAYGIPARSVDCQDEAEGAISDMLAHDGPYLLECVCPPDFPSL